MKMKLKTFIEDYSGGPFFEEEIADIASNITDSDLGDKARVFINARDEFLETLSNNGFEWG